MGSCYLKAGGIEKLMIEREIMIHNRDGLHTKPAILFAERASKFQSEITLYNEEFCADGKSILSLIGLGATQGSTVRLCARGRDEEQAVSILSELIENHFQIEE